MWGTWWVWDARLTSVLVLFFLYLGYIALVNAFDDASRGARAGSLLALVGVVNLPIIKFSVDWWNTLHQPASVVRLGGPAIDASMLLPLLVMAVGFMLLFGWLLLLRMRTALNERKAARPAALRRSSAARPPRAAARPAGAERGMNALADWLAMGGYAGFVWPAYGFAAAVLGGLALYSWRQHRAQRGRSRPAAAAAPVRADDPQAAAPSGAGRRAGRCSARRPLWCWPRSTTTSCSSTARASLRRKTIGPDRRIRIGGLVETAKPASNWPAGRASRSASPTARPNSRSSMTACCPTCSARGRGSSPRGGCGRDGVFAASSVLAKHDEKYMPPEVADALKKSGRWQEGGARLRGKPAALPAKAP